MREYHDSLAQHLGPATQTQLVTYPSEHHQTVSGGNCMRLKAAPMRLLKPSRRNGSEIGGSHEQESQGARLS